MNRDSKGFRTVRLRTLLSVIGAFVLVVLAIGFWQREFLSEQKRAVILGNFELIAEKYSFSYGDDVDAVEIFEIEQGARIVSTFTLRIGSQVEKHGIGVKKSLSAEETKKFMQRWSRMHFHWGLSGMCHEPGFIVRFLKDGKPVLETTLCFKCQNFEAPSALGPTLMGFEKKSPDGQAFVAHFKGLFPDSQKWAELEKEQKKPAPVK